MTSLLNVLAGMSGSKNPEIKIPEKQVTCISTDIYTKYGKKDTYMGHIKKVFLIA